MSTKLGFLVKVWRGKGAALQAGSFTFFFWVWVWLGGGFVD